MSEIRIQGQPGKGGDQDPGPAGYDPTPEEIESLRIRSAEGLERGLAFLARHGNERALLRAHTLLGVTPVEECASSIARAQRAEGAFESLGMAAGGARGLAETGLDEPQLATLEALVALSDLSAHHHPCVEPAAVFLASVQLEDGSWGQPSAPAEKRIFATGMLAGLLGRTRVVRPQVLDAAGNFLGELFSPDLISGRRWVELTGFGTFFANVGHDLADSALQWVGRELERGFRTRSYDASSTLRTLLHCNALAVPGATLDPFLLLTDLLGEQAADGGFEELAQGVDATRIEPTLDALLGIIRICEGL